MSKTSVSTHFCEMLFHNLRTIIDRQNDVCHTGSCQSFNLVENHRLIAKFNQWLRESESLLLISHLGLLYAGLESFENAACRVDSRGMRRTRGRRRVPKPPTRIIAVRQISLPLYSYPMPLRSLPFILKMYQSRLSMKQQADNLVVRRSSASGMQERGCESTLAQHNRYLLL